jgi:hypothetical protein
MALKVTAPMITARTENDRIVYLYHGDVVPDGLSKESLEHLKGLGFIADAKAADKADVAQK